VYEIDFWNNARLSEFWDMVTSVLKFASPGVLIMVAVAMVGLLFSIVIGAVKQASNKNKDDDDFDIKYY